MGTALWAPLEGFVIIKTNIWGICCSAETWSGRHRVLPPTEALAGAGVPQGKFIYFNVITIPCMAKVAVS